MNSKTSAALKMKMGGCHCDTPSPGGRGAKVVAISRPITMRGVEGGGASQQRPLSQSEASILIHEMYFAGDKPTRHIQEVEEK